MPRPARTDLIGRRFERLVITCLTEPGEGRRKLVAMCDCGNEIVTDISSVERGATTSCGCARVKHGHATGKASPTYNSWAMMHDRCRNPNDERYADYGGRGISVCARWSEFHLFLQDMGVRPAGNSIDRINFNGNYEPGNCRWATAIEQTRNRRVSILVVVGGEQITLKEYCRRTGQDYQRARAKIKKGVPPIEAGAL